MASDYPNWFDGYSLIVARRTVQPGARPSVISWPPHSLKAERRQGANFAITGGIVGWLVGNRGWTVIQCVKTMNNCRPR